MTALPRRLLCAAIPIALAASVACAPHARAQDGDVAGSKPNILYIVSDDHGWGDTGPYLGGEERGMPSPNFDRLAAEGMMFTSFYGQPSCTPSRAAMQTGRIPNRSGMTTVAFQGQGGGLPAAEWTLASILKTAGYSTYFTGKWHLGEDDYALPIAHGYDTMEHVFLYALNGYTYADPNWFPDMPQDMRDMYNKVTKGSLSGEAGGEAKEDWKVDARTTIRPTRESSGFPSSTSTSSSRQSSISRRPRRPATRPFTSTSPS
jgi:arylsulfatase A-like enzyme